MLNWMFKSLNTPSGVGNFCRCSLDRQGKRSALPHQHDAPPLEFVGLVFMLRRLTLEPVSGRSITVNARSRDAV